MKLVVLTKIYDLIKSDSTFQALAQLTWMFGLLTSGIQKNSTILFREAKITDNSLTLPTKRSTGSNASVAGRVFTKFVGIIERSFLLGLKSVPCILCKAELSFLNDLGDISA